MAAARVYPEFNRRFGQYLRELRGDRSYGMLEIQLERLGLPGAIKSSTLSLDEQGKVKDIPVERLDLYSRLYETPFELVVCRLVQYKYGVDFSSRVQVDAPKLEGVHTSLQRILEEAPEEERRWIETAIDLVASRIPAKKPARVLPHRPRQPVVTVGRLSDLEDEHDEPQPVHTAELPYFEYRVPAGPPDEVEADGYQTIEVLRHLVKESRYVVRVAGDSMEPEIRNGDLILVDYAEQPRNGKIVCALINGKGTVKEFHKRGARIVLKPKNPKHEDIVVKEGSDFRVQGVVKGIVNRRID